MALVRFVASRMLVTWLPMWPQIIGDPFDPAVTDSIIGDPEATDIINANVFESLA